jgi:hypothetical protein
MEADPMKKLLVLSLCLGGCAHGEKQALAVLAVSVDEAAETYAEAKRRRLVHCEATSEDIEEARKCMGPYFGDRGTQLLEAIVAAQEAMTEGVEALNELRELTEGQEQ